MHKQCHQQDTGRHRQQLTHSIYLHKERSSGLKQLFLRDSELYWLSKALCFIWRKGCGAWVGTFCAQEGGVFSRVVRARCRPEMQNKSTAQMICAWVAMQKNHGAWTFELCHVKSALKHGLQRAVRKRTAFTDGFLVRNLLAGTRPGARRSAFGGG